MKNTRKIPDRVVMSRKPSPFSKCKIKSTFLDSTVEQHMEDFKKFIKISNEKQH